MPSPPIRPHWSATLRDFLTLMPRERIKRSTLTGCPEGDGSAVLVLPGILRSDDQTVAFREALGTLGYKPFGWELGLNVGPTRGLMEGVTQRLTVLAAAHGGVRLVGFSMGGLFARWLAHRRTAQVRQVVTVACPFRDPLNAAWIPLRPLQFLWPEIDVGALTYMIRQPPPVPWGALYSKRDGIVAWQSCTDPNAPDHCLEVACRHKPAAREAEVFRGVARFLGEV